MIEKRKTLTRGMLTSDSFSNKYNTNVNVGNTVEKVEKTAEGQRVLERELERQQQSFCCIKAKAADSQKIITVFCDQIQAGLGPVPITLRYNRELGVK